MDIKVLKNEGFTLSGSGVLRAFQNEKMPSLDLLIREAIQNSMDAIRTDKNYVKEEINVDQFNVRELIKFFPQISNLLLIKSRLGYNQYISISDRNTVGLTGPIRIQDIEGTNWGRFLSLTEGIAKPQENLGAGGSWGYGKTVYYRIGIGLVIFYSRIKDGNQYKNRLMACLVENEKDENSILNYANEYNEKTGVAWWGKKDEKFENTVVPLEDKNEIQEILSCFNLKIYEGDETGTSIIIPFIDEGKLLNKTTSANIDDSNLPYWCRSLKDYLSLAVQKWYPTKIMNRECSFNYFRNFNTQSSGFEKTEVNPWLELYINSKPFTRESMLPLFSVMQELYNYAIHEDYESNLNIKTEPIILKNVFTQNRPAGKLVYVSLTKNDLKMTAPNNEESPYTQINNERMEDENNSNVIIAFCRRPGMILRYSTDDEWTNGIINPKEDTYVIALFVPNGYNEIEIIEDTKVYRFDLEEYLRASEEADHNNWTDIGEFNYENTRRIDVSNLKIVGKIQKGIKAKLKNELKIEEKETTISVGTVLSIQLTKWFLPKKGFGKIAIKTKDKYMEDTNKIKVNRLKKSKIELKSLEVTKENEMYKRISLDIYENDTNLDYSFKIVTENENINANKWENESNIKFPVEITKIEIDNVIYKDGSIKEILSNLIEKNNSEIYFEKKKTDIYNIWYGFKINILNKNINNINGKIFYRYIDSNIEINIERE